MPDGFEYDVVDEPNAAALRERLERASREGWEALSLACAGECRLFALLRRHTQTSQSPYTTETSAGSTGTSPELRGRGTQSNMNDPW